MMPYPKSNRTVKKLSTADYRFTLLADYVLERMDIGVYESDRTTKRQIQMFENGRSQLDGIKNRSKHQISEKYPLSRAIDCYPYKRGLNVFKMCFQSMILWKQMNDLFYEASVALDIPIVQGCNWDFKDYPHQELV